MIHVCECDHPYQDKKYGHRKRVHTVGKAKGGGKKLVCTVCRREKTINK